MWASPLQNRSVNMRQGDDGLIHHPLTDGRLDGLPDLTAVSLDGLDFVSWRTFWTVCGDAALLVNRQLRLLHQSKGWSADRMTDSCFSCLIETANQLKTRSGFSTEGLRPVTRKKYQPPTCVGMCLSPFYHLYSTKYWSQAFSAAYPWNYILLCLAPSQSSESAGWKTDRGAV